MRARALVAVLLGLAAAGGRAQTAPAPGDLVVNEVLYDPPAGGSGNEWVEVYNRSGRVLDLQGLVVTDASGASGPVAGSVPIASGGYAVLASDADAFAASYPGVAFTALDLPPLNNGGDRVGLVVGGSEVDAVPYQPSWGGDDASLERRDPFGPSDAASNFGTTTGAPGGTPGAQNTLFSVDEAPPTTDAVEALDAATLRVTFSEPVGAGAELATSYTLDAGAPAPATATLGPPTTVTLALAAPLGGPAAYTLTVRGVADLRGNAIGMETATFFFGEGAAAAPRDVVVNEFLYDPPASTSPGEYVELFNRTDASFDLREFTLNDGTGDDEPITDEPVFLGPGEYAVVVQDGTAFAAAFPGVPFVDQPTWSALNNSGDAIVLTYLGTTVDSLSYTTAWGGDGVALERKDPGAASARANFAPSTDARAGTPGALNSQFELDVTGPRLVAATASVDGRTLRVTLDEPADPASVSASAFDVTGAPVESAGYDGDVTVTLALASPVATGDVTVTASGLRDPLGNGTDETSTTFAFVADETPPTLASASVVDATTVRVVFTEPVTIASAGAPTSYSVSDGVGAPTSVAADVEDGDATGAVLTLGAALEDRAVYALTASGLVDLAGNAGGGTAALFFGRADVPGPGEIVVTEVMYDPQGGSDGEYIEILNTTSDRIFDLRSVTYNGDAIADMPAVLTPGQRLAVVADAEGFAVAFPGVPALEAGSFDALSNGGETVRIASGSVLIDSVAYDPDWHRPELDDATGISLERRDAAGPSSAASNWSSSLDERGGTPGAPNSVRVAGGEAPLGGVEVTSPFAPDEGESARISYALAAEASLVRIRIYDAGGRFVRELVPGRLSGREGSEPWDGRGARGERLRVGYYVVLVEAVDAAGGTTEAHKATVVLARR